MWGRGPRDNYKFAWNGGLGGQGINFFFLCYAILLAEQIFQRNQSLNEKD